MSLVTEEFINLLSPRLGKFKKVRTGLWNFRCPLCGDSAKRKNVSRGYLYSVKTNVNYKCHNCGASMSFANFLQHLDPELHKRYTLQNFKEGNRSRSNAPSEKPKFSFKAPTFKTTIKLPLCSDVDSARDYLERRKLDPSKFYYAEDFDAFVKSFKKDQDLRKEPRIVIPLYQEKQLIGFQGRALLANSKPKYLTVMLQDDVPKIYGLDNIRTDAPVYVTEGPFDSTFIRNSIAMCGADADVSRWGISDPVWIYDNEPRNREITGRIERTIASGSKIVIWPAEVKQKDINDMILAGHDVQSIVECNVYSGLEATLKFNQWKKI